MFLIEEVDVRPACEVNDRRKRWGSSTGDQNGGSTGDSTGGTMVCENFGEDCAPRLGNTSDRRITHALFLYTDIRP